MSPTTVISTRIPDTYAASLRKIAELRRTSVADVAGRILRENLAPTEPAELAGAFDEAA